MIPVNQFILGGGDPLLLPSEKMTNSIDEQIAFLQSQKQAINEAYRRNAVAAANNGVVQNQQVIPQQPVNQGIWDAIDAEIAPLTQEQQNMLLTNNIDSFDKFLKPIADKDGMIDIEGIFDEEMEVINNIDNFDFDIPFIGGGNIDNKVFESAITFWFKDVDFDGDKVWEYFHMNN